MIPKIPIQVGLIADLQRKLGPPKPDVNEVPEFATVYEKFLIHFLPIFASFAAANYQS